MHRLSDALHDTMEALHDSWIGQQQLADDLNVSRESVARRGTMLEKEGLVEMRRIGARGRVIQRNSGNRGTELQLQPTELGFAYLGEHVYMSLAQ